MNTEKIDHYIENLKLCRALNRPEISLTLNDDEIINTISNNAARAHDIMLESNEFLSEIVFSKDPKTLTDDEIAYLQEFYGRLFDFAASLDTGIAYVVASRLLECARYRGDKPFIIRELYDTGIALHYMNSSSVGYLPNPLRERIVKYFIEGASYLDEYDSFDITTKKYILRCLGNTKIDLPRESRETTAEYLRRFDHAMSIFTSEEYHR